MKRLFFLFLLIAVLVSFSGCRMLAEVVGAVPDADTELTAPWRRSSGRVGKTT